MIRVATALTAMAFLAGCATDRVTLLDNEDNAKQFAVANITNPGCEREITTENSELRLHGCAKPRTLAKPRPNDARLMTNLPPRVATSRLMFETGESGILPKHLAELDRLSREIADRKEKGFDTQVEVLGFTDSEGSESRNLEISLARAHAVASQLRSRGFEIADLDIIGRGEFEALANGRPDELANPDYRRVDVVVR